MLMTGNIPSARRTPSHFRMRPVRKSWVKSVSTFTERSIRAKIEVRSALVAKVRATMSAWML